MDAKHHGRLVVFDLVPRDYLRIIALWSLIPAYALLGGFLGYLADSRLQTLPLFTAIGLLLSLALAVWEMYRLRDKLF
jgi:F0F1-type ATP synthase assembly protein I